MIASIFNYQNKTIIQVQFNISSQNFHEKKLSKYVWDIISEKEKGELFES